MGTARKATAAVSPAEQRAKTLEHLITLNMGLNNALDALEIARDTAATPAARQQAENEIPAIVQAKALLKNKTMAFIKKSPESAISPPSQAIIDKTLRLSEDLGKVDAQTAQFQSLLSLAGRLVELVNLL